jgi:hypothetical protein
MSLDLFLKIVSTIATLFIGVAASALAFQQFRISKAKLKFDLYEKRLALFKIVGEYVSDLAIGDNYEPLKSQGNALKFHYETIECRFLFGKDVEAHIEDIYKNAVRLARVRLNLLTPRLTEEDKQSLDREVVALRGWFLDQSDEMFKLVKDDLSIKTLR